MLRHDMSNPLTRERELAGVLAAMREYGLDKGLILTNSTRDTLSPDTLALDGRTVEVRPVADWLLENRSL